MDAAAPAFSKVNVVEDVNPALVELVSLNLQSHVGDSVVVDIFVKEGEKRTLTLRRTDRIPRQLKLKVMQRAPGLFAADDPDWLYAGKDERAEQLFEAVKV